MHLQRIHSAGHWDGHELGNTLPVYKLRKHVTVGQLVQVTNVGIWYPEARWENPKLICLYIIHNSTPADSLLTARITRSWMSTTNVSLGRLLKCWEICLCCTCKEEACIMPIASIVLTKVCKDQAVAGESDYRDITLTQRARSHGNWGER